MKQCMCNKKDSDEISKGDVVIGTIAYPIILLLVFVAFGLKAMLVAFGILAAIFVYFYLSSRNSQHSRRC